MTGEADIDPEMELAIRELEEDDLREGKIHGGDTESKGTATSTHSVDVNLLAKLERFKKLLQSGKKCRYDLEKLKECITSGD